MFHFSCGTLKCFSFRELRFSHLFSSKARRSQSVISSVQCTKDHLCSKGCGHLVRDWEELRDVHFIVFPTLGICQHEPSIDSTILKHLIVSCQTDVCNKRFIPVRVKDSSFAV